MQENIAVISLKNIRYNFAVFKKRLCAGTKFFAVVKADAYGHGAERVSETLEGLADGFVVTSVREGIALRASGVQGEILVLTPPIGLDDAFLAAAHGLTLTVCSVSALRFAAAGAEKDGKPVAVHIKVNTGMNRLGLCGAPLKKLFSLAERTDGVRVRGIYSHLYAPADAEASDAQRRIFESAAEEAKDRFGGIVCHLAATGGTLAGQRFHFDGVRIGIGLYGYLPGGFEGFAPALGLRPAMRLYTHVLQSHHFTGGGVGYARADGADYGDLTVCRLGYADGFLRSGGGGRLRAIGNLCMDGCVRQGRAKSGQRRAVFFSADKVAEDCKTISYEVLCAAAKRAVKIYEEC